MSFSWFLLLMQPNPHSLRLRSACRNCNCNLTKTQCRASSMTGTTLLSLHWHTGRGRCASRRNRGEDLMVCDCGKWWKPWKAEGKMTVGKYWLLFEREAKWKTNMKHFTGHSRTTFTVMKAAYKQMQLVLSDAGQGQFGHAQMIYQYL